MKKNKILLFLIVCLLIPSQTWCQNQFGFHGLDNSLLSIGYNAPALALAEANIAQNNNPFAGFNNPAGLSDIKNAYLYSLHGQLSYETEIFSLNYTSPLTDSLVMNIAWVQMQITQIPLVATVDADLNTDLAADSYTVSLSNGFIAAFAQKFSENLSVGLAASLYQNNFSELSEKGYGFSLSPGLNYQFNKEINLGVYLKNALSLQSWSTGHKENLERIVNLGIAYKLTPEISLFSSINKGLSSSAKANFQHSLELSLFDFLKLRFGIYPENLIWPIYQINSGLGVNIGNISFDYAYIGGSKYTSSDTSRITIGVKL